MLTVQNPIGGEFLIESKMSKKQVDFSKQPSEAKADCPVDGGNPPAVERYLQEQDAWQRFVVKGKEKTDGATLDVHDTIAQMSRSMDEHQSMRRPRSFP